MLSNSVETSNDNISFVKGRPEIVYFQAIRGERASRYSAACLTEQEQLCNECNIHDWPHINRINK